MEYVFDDVKKMITEDTDIILEKGTISLIDITYTFDLLSFIMKRFKITPDEMIQALQENNDNEQV
jgi:hypothetical protein